jgi:hypothetical protein
MVSCISVSNKKRDVADWWMMIALGMVVTAIAWLSARGYALFSGSRSADPRTWKSKQDSARCLFFKNRARTEVIVIPANAILPSRAGGHTFLSES